MSRQFTHKKRDTNGPFTYKKMVSITDNKKKITETSLLLI